MGEHSNGRRAIALIPNGITVAALVLGMSAVVPASRGSYAPAVVLIVLAAVLDGLDGFAARRLNATSELGAQLDSLSDAVVFGAVPAIVLFGAALDSAGGWALILAYLVCVVFRLARFNLHLARPSPDRCENRYERRLVGVPAPLGAIIALSPIAISEQWGQGWWLSHWFVGSCVVGAAALMASRLPTLSLKNLSVPWLNAVVIVCILAIALVLIAGARYLFGVYVVFVGVYLLHIPLASRGGLRRRNSAGRAAARRTRSLVSRSPNR